MPQDGSALGAVAPVPGVRPRRLLRLVAGTSCDRSLQRHWPPGNAVLQSGGQTLEVVLRASGISVKELSAQFAVCFLTPPSRADCYAPWCARVAWQRASSEARLVVYSV